MSNHYQSFSSCDFAAEIVSYVYSESNEAEKRAFENHLVKCATCAAELNDFAALRSSIGEWREIEFAGLESPAIEIPRGNSAAVLESSSGFSSRAEKLRRSFALTPWRAAAFAVAVLTVCFGLTLVAVKLPGGDLVAEKESFDRFRPNVSPTAQASIEQKSAAKVLPDAANNSHAVIAEQKQAPAPLSAKAVARTTVKVVASPNSADAKVRQKTEVSMPLRIKSVNDENLKVRPASRREASKLNVDDEEIEDDSLRLADLFEEIDTK